MQRAGMPVAGVDEDCNAGAGKGQIGSASDTSQWELAVDEVPQPKLVHRSPDGHLRLGVPNSLRLHRAALRRGGFLKTTAHGAMLAQ
jgi:hypothetical protein